MEFNCLWINYKAQMGASLPTLRMQLRRGVLSSPDTILFYVLMEYFVPYQLQMNKAVLVLPRQSRSTAIAAVPIGTYASCRKFRCGAFYPVLRIGEDPALHCDRPRYEA